MKRILFLLMAMLVVFVLVTPVHAYLITRGTDILGWRLIYDDDLDITWYGYTNSVNTWQNQVLWANNLSVTFGSTTYSDWRLPMTVDGPYVYGYDGTTTGGYNITNSEMGHLYYTELGNLGYYATDGTYQPGYGLYNFLPFTSLNPYAHYWSGTENASNSSDAWMFGFTDGKQYTLNKVNSQYYAMAVRPGDVAVVPEPATVALLGIGLAGMAAFGVRRRRQRG